MFFLDRFRRLLPGDKTRDELERHYDELEGVGLEKGDFFAMVVAAFITFFPVLIVAMAVFFGLLWLLVSR